MNSFILKHHLSLKVICLLKVIYPESGVNQVFYFLTFNLKTMAEKTRYSDAELAEFKAIILEKLAVAQRNYDQLRATLDGSDSNDVDDTSPTYKVLEEGAATLSKEENTRLAQRQLKFINGLQAALVRIENKTYGICRETGKLIPAERLRAVPHATLSIEAKNSGKK